MSEERDVEARLDAVLADARDALAESVEGEEVVATPTLRAVASAASSLVEDADSESLLNAVDLGGEDGYDTIVTALSEGDEENVRELRQLLRLSKLADSWDDPEAEDHRRELATLFGIDEQTDDEDTDDGESVDAEEAVDPDQTDDGTADEDGLAEDIVDTVVERFTDEGDDSADTDDGSSESEADADEGTDEKGAATASLRSQVEGAVGRLRDQVGEDDGDDEADETDTDDEDDGPSDSSSDASGGRRLSTMPEQGRNPTRFSTMPQGGSSTRFSTMPKR